MDREIADRAARGESAETIQRALDHPVSLATMRRRVTALRRGTSPLLYPSDSPPPPLVSPSGSVPPIVEASPETIPDRIPEGADREELNRWLDRLERSAKVAETMGDLSALASIAAKVTAIMALKHRSQPLPKRSPEDDPDMIALAKSGEEKLLGLVRGIRTQQSPEAG
jgi:hypothetical protein